MGKKKEFIDVCAKFRADAAREFGNRLTEVRDQHKLTQPEMIRNFVESAPATPSGYSRWETGTSEPNIAFLKQLHKRWNIDLNWLIAGDEQYMPSVPENVFAAIKILDDFRRDCIFRK